MKFRVRILQRAQLDFREILKWLGTRSRSGASSWARAFDEALARLENDPASYPLAPESDHSDCEVREILFKTRRGLSYRILFFVEVEDVYILHVRGAGQDFLTADELELE